MAEPWPVGHGSATRTVGVVVWRGARVTPDPARRVQVTGR